MHSLDNVFVLSTYMFGFTILLEQEPSGSYDNHQKYLPVISQHCIASLTECTRLRSVYENILYLDEGA